MGWRYKSFKRYERFKGYESLKRGVSEGEVGNGYVCGGTRQQETDHVPVSCQQVYIVQSHSPPINQLCCSSVIDRLLVSSQDSLFYRPDAKHPKEVVFIDSQRYDSADMMCHFRKLAALQGRQRTFLYSYLRHIPVTIQQKA